MQSSKKGQKLLDFDSGNKSNYKALDEIRFDVLVKDIHKLIGNEWNTLNMNGAKFSNKAICIMVGETIHNPYIKSIIENSSLSRVNEWNIKYKQYNFNDRHLRMDAAKELIQYCRQNKEDAYCYVFWLLLVVAIDKFDFDKRLSFICDISQLVRIKEDEFEDLIHVVKYVCMVPDEGYEYKTETVKKLFSGVLELYD